MKLQDVYILRRGNAGPLKILHGYSNNMSVSITHMMNKGTMRGECRIDNNMTTIQGSTQEPLVFRVPFTCKRKELLKIKRHFKLENNFNDFTMSW